MAYGDTTRTRELAGNPSTTLVSASDVTQAVAIGDAKVNLITQRSTWSSSDPEWALIQTASELIASWNIRSRFQDPDDKATKQYLDAMKILEEVIKNSGSVFVTSASNYHSWPANPQAGPYKSNSTSGAYSNSDGTSGDPGDI